MNGGLPQQKADNDSSCRIIGAGYFTGLHDNTEVPQIFAKLLGNEGLPHVCE